VKSAMTAFLAKLKRGLGYAGNIVLWIFALWITIGLVVKTIELLSGTGERQPRAYCPSNPW
jgi:hypothetical protein